MRVFQCSCFRVLALLLVSLSPAIKAEGDRRDCRTRYYRVSLYQSKEVSYNLYSERETCTGWWWNRRCRNIKTSSTKYKTTYMILYEARSTQRCCENGHLTATYIGSTCLKGWELTNVKGYADDTFTVGMQSPPPTSGLNLSSSTSVDTSQSRDVDDDSSSISMGVVVILVLVLLFVTIVIVSVVVISLFCLKWKRKASEQNGAGNRHSDFRAVSRTAYSNVDGVATIRDDTVVYSTVTSGGTNVVYDGIVSSPMYAVLEPEETAYEMYQYVPSKKRREVGGSKPQKPVIPIASIYGTIEETYQECKKPGHDDSPFKEPSAQLDQLYDDLAAMQCLEIPRKFLKFGPTLGSGEFGVVCKGEWVTPHGPREVALKVSREDVPKEEKVKLLQEAAIMKQFCHLNVVRLLGTVTISDPLVLIMELLKNGSLISYLMKLPTEMSASRKKLFMKFSQQIAEGMKYLSGKGFIHRDLAARNVLLDHEYTCKISDFGLSRNLDENTYYVVKGGKIPLRWTAPEVLFYKKYSSCSDVWSYGMTLFEIWSFGKEPFRDQSVQQIIDLFNSKLDESNSQQLLPCPKDCPCNVYSIMSRCWNFDQHSRPSFAEILAALSVQ